MKSWFILFLSKNKNFRSISGPRWQIKCKYTYSNTCYIVEILVVKISECTSLELFWHAQKLFWFAKTCPYFCPFFWGGGIFCIHLTSICLQDCHQCLFILPSESQGKSINKLKKHLQLEYFLISHLQDCIS